MRFYNFLQDYKYFWIQDFEADFPASKCWIGQNIMASLIYFQFISEQLTI